MIESGITSKGQTTLPKSVRSALGVEAGDKVRYLILDGGEVRLLRSRPVDDLAGLLADRDRSAVSLEGMEDAIAVGRTGGDDDRD